MTKNNNTNNTKCNSFYIKNNYTQILKTDPERFSAKCLL